ncbi:MAG: DNA repair protein RecO [Candidatus Sumerlaeota bacterium]|nr:DNA repair protein RecO [Candidatus Sumerlaeota bacterium]
MIDTEAIILKSAPSGETSRRLTVFSGEEGRFTLMARGAKSKKGQSFAVIEPYMIARVFASLKPEADLGTLTQAETVERFPHLREDLTRLAAAAVLCEVMDRGAEPRIANPRLYRYGAAFLRALDTESERKIFFLLGHGLMRAAQALGFGPEAQGCVGCGARKPAQWLDFEAGGLLCGDCRRQMAAEALGAESGMHSGSSRAAAGVSLEEGVAPLLAACAARPWRQIRGVTDDSPETKGLVMALARWLSHHVECEFKSIRFLFSAERLG